VNSIHPNSVLAYWEGRDELFGKRHQKVISALRQGGTLSDREVMIACGFSDMNAVRPRITELIEVGIVEPHGDIICPVTKKRVRLVRLAKREAQAEFDLGAALTPTVIQAISP
jgi:hypothetical protein